MFANHFAATIELSNTEAKKAGNPNTAEFKELIDLRSAFPEYSISVNAARKSSRDNYRGLSYDKMADYITKHDGDQAEANKNTLLALQGKNSDGSVNPTMQCRSYGEIKMWFLEMHPEIEAASKKTDDMLNSIKEKRAERKAAAEAAA